MKNPEKRSADALPYPSGLKRSGATDYIAKPHVFSRKFPFNENTRFNLKKRTPDALPYPTGLKRAEDFLSYI